MQIYGYATKKLEEDYSYNLESIYSMFISDESGDAITIP